MRINSLKVAGFGPYKTAQHVDFDAYADDGIFLISGKTGAGKSSILDAICFALYNAVPRYEGTDKQLRSHHSDPDEPSYVTLEFTIGDTRYRVHRTPEYERPAKRGGGMTTQKSDAELSVQRDGEWQGIAARPVDVGHELAGILGLTKDQFLQVILLAQNRFQQFLLARNEERQAVLQTLFGTQRFELYEKAIVERARDMEARLGDAREQRERDVQRARELLPTEELHAPDAAAPPHPDDAVAPTSETAATTDLDWFERGLAAVDQRLLHAGDAVLAAHEGSDRAEAAHRTLLDIQSRQTRRDAARTRLAQLEQERELIREGRERAHSATRAAVVAPHLAAQEGAERQLAAAADSEAAARDAHAEHGDRDADAAALTAAIDESSRTLGALEDAVEEEKTLPRLEREIAETQRTIEQLDTELAKGAARAADLPRLLTEAGDALTAALLEAGRASEAEASVARITAARRAAREAEKLSVRLDDARAAELSASRAHEAAAKRLAELLTARLHGYAGELAARLKPGEACSVCGSTEHPALAAAAAEPVTESDIDDAREAVDQRHDSLKQAESHAREIAEQYAAEQARTGGKDAEALEAEHAEASAALQRTKAAKSEADTLRREQESLEREKRELAEHQDEVREQIQRAQTLLVSARDRSAELGTRLARHRGEYDTVAARARDIRSAITAARVLADAIAAREQRASALEAATVTLATQLAEQGFDTVGEASDARLGDVERRELEQLIAAYERAEAIATSTLAEPELSGLPEEPVETDAAADAMRRARAELAEVGRVRAVLDERREQFHRLLEQVRARFAETDRLAGEYEQIAGLAAAVQGKGANTRRMRLETYVLAAQLEEIVAAANVRLRTMTGGRYELQHDDAVQYRKTQSGLGLSILDQHTGRARATHSLSGGETFLASLALALGLAEVVTAQSGGITLDTLFVDEGFGSLDGDTLEIAMSTLDSLRAGGRTIGLISHVDAMKEQIPAKLAIRVTDGGWSEIVQET